MRSEQEIRELLEKVLQQVSASDAVASYSEDVEVAARFGNNAITQGISGGDASVSLSVATGVKHGASRTNRLNPEGLELLVHRAEEVAADCPEDPEYMPPVEPAPYPDIPQRFYTSTRDAGPETIAEKISVCVEKARKNTMVAAGTFEVSVSAHAIANSKGLFCFDTDTSAEFGITVKAPEGTGKASGYNENIDAIDTAVLTDQAVETAAMNRDHAEMQPGDYTVVLSPDAASEFLEFLYWDMDAREADEGVNAFAEKTGEQLFDERVNLYSPMDDPDVPPPLFGSSGLPARKTVWVDKGRLSRLRHSRFWAKEKGTDPDPHMFPVRMDGEDRDFQDLIGMCDNGLLINRLWYIRYVDQKELLLTGMTRDGMFRIEGGKITRAVKNMRFNESPLVALNNIGALSRPQRTCWYAKVPGMLINNFTMSSTTAF